MLNAQENVQGVSFSIDDTLQHVVHLTLTVYNHPVSFAKYIYQLRQVILRTVKFHSYSEFRSSPGPYVDEYLIREKQDSCCRRRNWPLGRSSAGSPPRNSSKNDPLRLRSGRVDPPTFSFLLNHATPSQNSIIKKIPILTRVELIL